MQTGPEGGKRGPCSHCTTAAVTRPLWGEAGVQALPTGKTIPRAALARPDLQSPLGLLGILFGQQLVTIFPSITPTFTMKQESHKILSSSLTLVLNAEHYI